MLDGFRPAPMAAVECAGEYGSGGVVVSIHNGRRSASAFATRGQVTSPTAQKKWRRARTRADKRPRMGIARHVDAAIRTRIALQKKNGVKVPML